MFGNFLTQVIEDVMRRGAVLDFRLANKEELDSAVKQPLLQLSDGRVHDPERR